MLQFPYDFVRLWDRPHIALGLFIFFVEKSALVPLLRSAAESVTLF